MFDISGSRAIKARRSHSHFSSIYSFTESEIETKSETVSLLWPRSQIYQTRFVFCVSSFVFYQTRRVRVGEDIVLYEAPGSCSNLPEVQGKLQVSSQVSDVGHPLYGGAGSYLSLFITSHSL